MNNDEVNREISRQARERQQQQTVRNWAERDAREAKHRSAEEAHRRRMRDIYTGLAAQPPSISARNPTPPTAESPRPRARPVDSSLRRAARVGALIGGAIAVAYAYLVQHPGGAGVVGEGVAGLIAGALGGAVLAIAWALLVGLVRLVVRLVVLAFWIGLGCAIVWIVSASLRHV